VRTLAWDGCRNVRDLGGLPTEDGGVTRFGAVVRADNLRRLTPAGWRALLDYGVRSAVDLRRPDELAFDPPEPCPIGVVNVSLIGREPAVVEAQNAIISAAADPDEGIRAVYLDMLETFSGNFAGVVAAVARAPSGGVVIHCLVGRDRTGLVAALLLRVAGVGRAAVAGDWSLSGRNLAAELEEWVSAPPDQAEREKRLRWVHGSSPAAMESVLDELEGRYGSAREYLRAAGADEADLELVRGRLRG
jgi:protein tyrosine/serine phosphatase